MNPAERKIKAALEYAADLHRKGDGPSDAVAKSASFHELNPEMTRRVVEGFNIGKTNSTIAKAADKTASFPIASVDEVLKKVFVDSPLKTAAPGNLSKVAAGATEYAEALPDFTIDWVGNQKTAAPLGDFRDVVRQANSLKQGYQAELSKIAQDIVGNEIQMTTALTGLVEHFTLSENQGKFAEFEEQVLSEYGEPVRPTLGVVHDLAGLKDVRFDGLPKIGTVCFDSNRSHVMFDELMKATGAYHESQARYGSKLAEAVREVDELTALTKQAGGIAISGPETAADALLFSKGAKGFELPDVSRLPLISMEAPAHTLFSAAQSGVESADSSAYQAAHSKALEQRYKGPKEEADAELDNAKRQTILMRLMADDDIISRQEPGSITGAYNTLLGIAPDLTLQPEIVRAFLRSSGAQQAVDPFTAKQLAELQGVLSKNKSLARGDVVK